MTLREIIAAICEFIGTVGTLIRAAVNAILNADLTPLFEVALVIGASFVGLYAMAQIWHAAIRVWRRVWGDRADAAGKWLWRGIVFVVVVLPVAILVLRLGRTDA